MESRGAFGNKISRCGGGQRERIVVGLGVSRERLLILSLSLSEMSGMFFRCKMAQAFFQVKIMFWVVGKFEHI